MKCINVLYISNDSIIGGATISLLDMLYGMRLYYNVNPIVVLPSNGRLKDELNKLGVKYYVVEFSNGFGLIGHKSEKCIKENYRDNYKAARKIQNIIKKEKIQLVHINSSTSNVGAITAILTGIPYIWHIRELLEEQFDSEYWDKELKVLLMNHASFIIAISNTVSRVIKNRYHINSSVVYDGVNSSNYISTNREINIKESVNNFIITGCIDEGKGQIDAIKAVELLVKEGIDDINLFIVGRGDTWYRWYIERYIENKNLKKYIQICPFCLNLRELRNQCKYSLTTSRYEALGRCTIEPMINGNIVIGADTAGTLEIIGKRQERGYLYKAGDAKSLAQTMKYVLKLDSEEVERKRDIAREYVLDSFDLKEYCDKIYKIYKKVIVEKRDNEVLKEELHKKFLDSMLTKNCKEENVIYSDIIKKWNNVINEKYKMADYLNDKNVKTIAIYGMGKLGCKLYDELHESEEKIEISYVVDRKSKYLSDLFKVVNPKDKFPLVDLMIVCVSMEEKEIKEFCENKCSFAVKGISEILDDIMRSN